MTRRITATANEALSEEERLDREAQAEAGENKEAARLWISGIEALKRKVGLRAVYDLSATPFFLRGSGYREGTLFPWVVSDFSLMDAIECGIVKLPRIPVADNFAAADDAGLPQFVAACRHAKPAAPPSSPARPAGDAADRAVRALYHYETYYERVGAGPGRRAAGVHRRVPEHRDLALVYRVDRRLRARPRRRDDRRDPRLPPRRI